MKKFSLLFMLIFTLLSTTFFVSCGDSGSSDDPAITYPEGSDANTPPTATTSTARISSIVFTGDVTKTETFTYGTDDFITRIDKTGDPKYYMTFEFDASAYPTKVVQGDGINTYGASLTEDDVKTKTYTYSDGKLLTEKEERQREGTLESNLMSFDTWSGYLPTHGVYTQGAFSADIIFTINSDGNFSLIQATSNGIMMSRETITYTATGGFTDLEEELNETDDTIWDKEKETIITKDTDEKITGRKITEYNNDGSYLAKELTYTYNTDGNVDTITFLRKEYDTSGNIIAANTKNYSAAITYITATSRPACNDILHDDTYAVEYLD